MGADSESPICELPREPILFWDWRVGLHTSRMIAWQHSGMKVNISCTQSLLMWSSWLVQMCPKEATFLAEYIRQKNGGRQWTEGLTCFFGWLIAPINVISDSVEEKCLCNRYSCRRYHHGWSAPSAPSEGWYGGHIHEHAVLSWNLQSCNASMSFSSEVQREIMENSLRHIRSLGPCIYVMLLCVGWVNPRPKL